jgi:SAM-dependent methyltransferase
VASGIRPDSAGGIGGPAQDAVLEDLSTAVHYIDWLAALCDPWLGEHPIEIGSGLGYYAERWRRPRRALVLSEADPRRREELSARFAGARDIEVRSLTAPVTESAEYSAAVALNVLEHIEDDVAALRSFAGLVRAGGYVVVIVPAFPIGMSDFDRKIGHFRRYRRRVLRECIEAAGLQPVTVHYVNAVGLFGWLVLMRLLRGRPRDSVALRVFDRMIVPVLRRIESRWHPPCGQSVLGVARVPATT